MLPLHRFQIQNGYEQIPSNFTEGTYSWQVPDQQEGKHTVSICMHVEYNGEVAPQIMETDKCESLMWVSPDALPEPHFEASRNAIDLWLNQNLYHHKA